MYKTRNFVLAALVFFCGNVIYDNAIAADTDALKTMAGIMIKLNHYPNDSEKKMLNSIGADGNNSKDVRTIATAMAKIEHTVADSDKSKLQAVIDDGNASQNVRDLASIVLHIEHKPSSEDKTKLKGMM